MVIVEVEDKECKWRNSNLPNNQSKFFSFYYVSFVIINGNFFSSFNVLKSGLFAMRKLDNIVNHAGSSVILLELGREGRPGLSGGLHALENLFLLRNSKGLTKGNILLYQLRVTNFIFLSRTRGSYEFSLTLLRIPIL